MFNLKNDSTTNCFWEYWPSAFSYISIHIGFKRAAHKLKKTHLFTSLIINWTSFCIQLYFIYFYCGLSIRYKITLFYFLQDIKLHVLGFIHWRPLWISLTLCRFKSSLWEAQKLLLQMWWCTNQINDHQCQSHAEEKMCNKIRNNKKCH